MRYNRKKIGIGAEGKDHCNLSLMIKQYQSYGFMQNCIFWTYNAGGEKRTAITGGLLKRKGLAKGMPDYFFLLNKDGIIHNIYLEMKAGKNKLTEEQQQFFNNLKDYPNAKCYVAYSVQEALQQLHEAGIITKLK